MDPGFHATRTPATRTHSLQRQWLREGECVLTAVLAAGEQLSKVRTGGVVGASRAQSPLHHRVLVKLLSTHERTSLRESESVETVKSSPPEASHLTRDPDPDSRPCIPSVDPRYTTHPPVL